MISQIVLASSAGGGRESRVGGDLVVIQVEDRAHPVVEGERLGPRRRTQAHHVHQIEDRAQLVGPVAQLGGQASHRVGMSQPSGLRQRREHGQPGPGVVVG